MLPCAVSSGRRLGIAALTTAIALVLIALPRGAGAADGPGRPDDLTVDGLAAPIGLAASDVQFGWHVVDGRRGAIQRAYRIMVSQASGPAVWDSGRVDSSDEAFVPYQGPPLAPDTAYRWTVQNWDASDNMSALAKPGSFETGLGDGDWRASWIRRPTDDTVEFSQYTYARKETALGRSPIARARAYVSADQQYELSINGVRVGKGLAYSYPDSQYYETLDVTAVLRAGAPNAIALLYSWQGAAKGHPAGTPGAIVQISVRHRDGSFELITTDGTWRVQRGAWSAGAARDQEGDQVDYTENIVGPAQPVGWDEPGFDDHVWSAATVLGRAPVSPWSHLVPVRTRLVEAPVAPVALARLPSGAYVADFGRVYAAVPTVTFHHGIPARLVVMRAGYLLDQSGDVSVLRGTQHTDMSYSYVQRGGSETFRPFDYLGFRYFEIQNPGEALSPGDVVAFARHTAVPDEALATFSSSDPGVDAVFALGRHSALFSAQEQFVDTPTREKGPWLWDGFNESQTEMAAFDELNLTRKDLLEFAQSQARYWPEGAVNKIYPTGLGAQDIGEFTEVYAEWVWQYWFHTGDRPLLHAVYPVLSKLSDYLAKTITPSSGLLPNLPATNVYSTLDVVTRQNVLGVNVFRRAGDAAHVLGLAADETGDRQRQAALTAAINAGLTLPNGLYVDGLAANGSKAAPTQDASAVASAYDVAPAGIVATLGSVIASEGMSVPPRTATEVLATLRKTGRDDDFVRRLTDQRSDGWANILAQGATFTWEVWHPSDANGDSMSHGWGSNVLVEIQRELLGVSPTSAGFATFAVTPPHAGLAWAQGSVPTPRGSVGVSWQRPPAAGGAFSLDVTVPPNTTATLRLPAIGTDAVTEGGLPWRDLHLEGGDAVIVVGAGTYHFRSAPVPASAAGVGVNGPGPGTGPRPAAPASAGGGSAPGSGQAPEPGLSAGPLAAGTSTAHARGGGGHDVARASEVAAALGGLIVLIAVARASRRRSRLG